MSRPTHDKNIRIIYQKVQPDVNLSNYACVCLWIDYGYRSMGMSLCGVEKRKYMVMDPKDVCNYKILAIGAYDLNTAGTLTVDPICVIDRFICLIHNPEHFAAKFGLFASSAESLAQRPSILIGIEKQIGGVNPYQGQKERTLAGQLGRLQQGANGIYGYFKRMLYEGNQSVALVKTCSKNAKWTMNELNKTANVQISQMQQWLNFGKIEKGKSKGALSSTSTSTSTGRSKGAKDNKRLKSKEMQIMGTMEIINQQKDEVMGHGMLQLLEIAHQTKKYPKPAEDVADSVAGNLYMLKKYVEEIQKGERQLKKKRKRSVSTGQKAVRKKPKTKGSG